MTRELTRCQIKARYRQTFAGFLWVILSPIVLFGVQALVFKYFLKIRLANYGLFLFGGLLPWIFIVNSLEMGIPVLVNSRQLLFAFKVEPAVLLAGSLLDNWINFLAAFLLVLVPMLITSGEYSFGLLLLPFATLTLLAGVAGIVALLAFLNVFYRDIRFLTHFLIGVLFYLTPVFYPREFILDRLQWAVELNPFLHLIQVVRECIYGFTFESFGWAFAKAVLVAAISLGFAGYFWERNKNELYRHL